MWGKLITSSRVRAAPSYESLTKEFIFPICLLSYLFKKNGRENVVVPVRFLQKNFLSNLILTFGNRKEIIGNIKLLMKMIKEDRGLDDEIIQLEENLENIRANVEELIITNSKIAQNQEEYTRKYNQLIEEYKSLEKELEQKNLELLNENKRVREFKIFIDSLEKQDELLTEYCTKLFNYLVEKIIIRKGKRVEIHLKNGEVISI